MRILAKIIVQLAVTLALLVTGFALGYPVGKHTGFESGSEWALIQADLAARDAGVTMPVYLEDGLFHVVIRQSPDLHRRARLNAVQHDNAQRASNLSYSLIGEVDEADN